MPGAEGQLRCHGFQLLILYIQLPSTHVSNTDSIFSLTRVKFFWRFIKPDTQRGMEVHIKSYQALAGLHRMQAFVCSAYGTAL